MVFKLQLFFHMPLSSSLIIYIKQRFLSLNCNKNINVRNYSRRNVDLSIHLIMIKKAYLPLYLYLKK